MSRSKWINSFIGAVLLSVAATVPAFAGKPDTDPRCEGLKGAAAGLCTAGLAAGCDMAGAPAAACEAIGEKLTQLTGEAPPWQLTYFLGCGDPVCRGDDPNFPYPPCTDQVAGDTCTEYGERCATGDGCNGTIVCADVNPQPVCPISRRDYKQNIHYLTVGDVEEYAQELLTFRLANYEYKDAANGAGTHLGFIIEDVEPSPAVDSGHDRVDLYGYTSMAIAALQVQQRQIEALERELAALREQLSALTE